MNIIIVSVIIILCTITINNTIITVATESKPRNIFDDYIKSMQEIYRLRLEAYSKEKQEFLNELYSDIRLVFTKQNTENYN